MEWIKKSDSRPDIKGRYLVASSFGVVTAWYDPDWSNKFQDCDTNCDEGMSDFDDNIFFVTHWMPLPEPPPEYPPLFTFSGSHSDAGQRLHTIQENS